MYGRRMSSVFSTSTTLRICDACQRSGTDVLDAHPTAALRGDEVVLTCTDRNLALCLAAMSWYMLSTASVRDISRYSLYMLCVPERES